MLIVDDEPAICDFLGGYFGTRFDVISVGSAEQALHVLLDPPPFDILLVDKNLPGMSGVELIRQVRAADENVSIVMITGYASAESIVETLNLGIDAYVEKPFKSLEEFSALVDAILRRKSVTPSSDAPARDASRPARIVGAIGDAVRRVDVAAALAPLHATIDCVATESELLALLSPEPDVVLLDADAWRSWSPKIVEQVNERAPFATCIVLSAGNLGTDALKTLVDLGVNGLLMWSIDPAWKTKLVEQVTRAIGPAPAATA
ncbi:MAG TPA: response regulator [bacterium]|nr:response regulator [bacterium]